MKPHMIITPADVLQARIRLGLTPLVQLDRAPGSSLHTDEHDKCRDFYECPCWNVLPAEPVDREPLDILTPFDATSALDEGDDFRSAMGDAYLCFYDDRYQAHIPELTCDGLVAFMNAPAYEGESERHRLGYIAGMLIAFGESNPRFYTHHKDEDGGAFDANLD